jgi:hypothetical protein
MPSSPDPLREAAQTVLTALDETGDNGETLAEFVGVEDQRDALAAALAAQPAPAPGLDVERLANALEWLGTDIEFAGHRGPRPSNKDFGLWQSTIYELYEVLAARLRESAP